MLFDVSILRSTGHFIGQSGTFCAILCKGYNEKHFCEMNSNLSQWLRTIR